MEKCEPVIVDGVAGRGPRWVRICLACLAAVYDLALIHSPDAHSLRPVTFFYAPGPWLARVFIRTRRT